MPLPSGYIKFSDEDFPTFCLPLFSFGDRRLYVQVPSSDGSRIARFAELTLPKDTRVHEFTGKRKPVDVDARYHFLLVIDSIHWFLGYDRELNVWAKENADHLNAVIKLQLAEMFPNEQQWLRARVEALDVERRYGDTSSFSEVLWRSIEAETLYSVVSGSARDIYAADLIRSVRRGLMLRSGLLVDDFIPDDVWNIIGDSLFLNRQELRALLSEKLGISERPAQKFQVHTTLDAADSAFFAREVDRISRLSSSATQLAIILRGVLDFAEKAAALLSLCQERKLLSPRQLDVLREVVNDGRHGVDRMERLRRALTYLIKDAAPDEIQSIFFQIDRYFLPSDQPDHLLVTLRSDFDRLKGLVPGSAIDQSPARWSVEAKRRTTVQRH